MLPQIFLFINLAALSVTPSFALVHFGPRATDSLADGPDATGWTPRPTSAPLLAGSLSELKLKKRQSLLALTNTCGWYDADPDEPFSCDAGLACAFNTAGSYFGCCSTDASGYFIDSDCAYIATPAAGCYDYTQASLCTGACYESNYVCGSTAPYCVSALLFGTSFQVLTHYACLTESSIRVLSVAATTTDASSVATVSVTIPVTTTAATTIPSLTTNEFIPSTSITTTSSSASSSPTPPPPNPSPSHTGAIAGGVVGGVAVIAVAVAGTLFFLRKRRNQRQVAVPEVSQM